MSTQLVVVTGCDHGIGYWVAKASLTWGFKVLAGCLSASSEGAKRLLVKGADVIKLDVTQEDDLRGLKRRVEEMEMRGVSLKCLVNNAGIMSLAPLEWHLLHHIKAVVRVNLEGSLSTTTSLLPSIRRNKGRIINVSSPQGMLGTPQLTPYCGAKWGVEGFTEALRRELSDCGVKVVTVRPCNLPYKTSIMRAPYAMLKEMCEHMDAATKTDYADEIASALKSHAELHQNGGVPFGEEACDEHLMECFRQAMCKENPSHSYMAAPFIVRLYLTALQLLPSCITDCVVKSSLHNKILNIARID